MGQLEIEGRRVNVLVDTGAQLNTITAKLVRDLQIEIHPLQNKINLLGTGGFNIPFLGFILAETKHPSYPQYCKTEFYVVLDDNSPAAEQVPVQAGIPLIDNLLQSAGDINETQGDAAWTKAAKARAIVNIINGAVVRSMREETIPARTTQVIKAAILTQTTLHEETSMLVEPRQGVDHVNAIASWTVVDPTTKTCQVVLHNNSSQDLTIGACTVLGNLMEATTSDAAIEGSTARVGAAQLSPEEGEGAPGVYSGEQIVERTESIWSRLHKEDWKDVPEDVQGLLKHVIMKNHQAFAVEKLEMGRTNIVQHHIELTDKTPFKERYRRIAPAQFEEVRKEIDDMLSCGAIQKSRSPWASAVVLARRKDGRLRFCIDLRKLNERTIKDAQTLPRIDESLDTIGGSKFFSSLDLKAGYWQVEMDEESRPYTAFTVGPLGFYECVRMPFGLTNAPSTFQRLMETCLEDINLKFCVIYLDDIIIFSKTLMEQIDRLDAVLQRLARDGLKLKPEKCFLLQRKITYLGHIVSEHGIEAEPRKQEALDKWPTPKTVRDIRSFLGFANHYRRFIPNYAKVARPLNNLTCGKEAQGKNSKMKLDWTPECQEAFEKLKELFVTAPVLAYADYQKPFKVVTDASGIGLGAALYQTDEEGRERPVAFASRSLNPAEKNYPAHKLEFLALKWVVTEQFHEYLYGSKQFSVHTDNNPLTYVMTTAKLDATSHRWAQALGCYNFSLHYKKGSTNVVADALSRIQWDPPRNEHGEYVIEQQDVPAFLTPNQEENTCYENAVGCRAINLSTLIHLQGVVPVATSEWERRQREDEVLGLVHKLMDQKQLHTRRFTTGDPEELGLYLREHRNLIRTKGLIYRKRRKADESGLRLQFCVPKTSREDAMRGCHDLMGHLGKDRSLDLLSDRFYWPKYLQHMEDRIKNCERCLRAKKRTETPELVNISAAYPMELLHMDYLTVHQTEYPGAARKHTQILVLTDHFTRYAQAYVTKNQKAETVAKCLWENFFCVYGFPRAILTDQGPSFEGKLMADLCKLAKIDKRRTTPYHPQCNGQVERFNQTLLSMLSCLEQEDKYRWKEHISTLVHAYNCTKNDATGFSPYQLMFGRQPRLAVDIQFGTTLSPEGSLDQASYVQKLQQRLQTAFDTARRMVEQQQNRAKQRYDLKAKASKLLPGDRVMLRQNRTTKIQDRWENRVYVVIEQPYGDNPVYRIAPQGGVGSRTVHRSWLFPLGEEDVPADGGVQSDDGYGRQFPPGVDGPACGRAPEEDDNGGIGHPADDVGTRVVDRGSRVLDAHQKSTTARDCSAASSDQIRRDLKEDLRSTPPGQVIKQHATALLKKTLRWIESN